MPREHRKKGKRNKKKLDDNDQDSMPLVEPPGGPSWMHSTPSEPTAAELNPEAPFGSVHADVKAYFRTVDIQMRDWQDTQHEEEAAAEPGDVDPNEQRHMFFVASLTEMNGKELQLATDPDCSVILERMIYSMDDFVRRVFMDSLTGSFERLFRHRFASHVCQTLFAVARDTIARETRGLFPDVPESPEQGELRTMTQLVLDASEELLASFSALIMDPFASHVVRALLYLLSPALTSEGSITSDSLRSKRSTAWKAKQGKMQSLFTDQKGKGREVRTKLVPSEFCQLSRRFVDIVRKELGDNEVRALATNKVASPVLQILLELEADHDMTNEQGSLMDRVTVGLITMSRDELSQDLQPTDYLNGLLRDPTSSHLLEAIVMRAPANAFTILWSLYFKAKLARLAVHPVANFVLAKALERVSAEQLAEACVELDSSWSKIIRSSRPGVLRAAIDRCSTLKTSESIICEAVYCTFELTTPEDRALLVPCVLCLLPLQEYRAAVPSADPTSREKKAMSKVHARQAASSPVEPTVQGSLLLQHLLQLSEPHNQIVIAGIMSLAIEKRLKLAQHPVSSRIYDAFFEASTTSSKDKRRFIMDFIGHYHTLVDDRFGSRIGDRCWAFSDTYLKEKIARSLIPQEQFLAGSYYGKFFARNLNMHLLKRRAEEWRTLQADRAHHQDHTDGTIAPVLNPETPDSDIPLRSQAINKRKRKAEVEDEIDAVFRSKLGSRTKKAALASAKETEVSRQVTVTAASELRDVFNAIRAAPGDVVQKRGRK